MKHGCPKPILNSILLCNVTPGKRRPLCSIMHGACECGFAIAIRRFLPLSAHGASRRADIQSAHTLRTHCSFPETSANRDLALDKRCLYCYNDNS
jgi:hypothetical protein